MYLLHENCWHNGIWLPKILKNLHTGLQRFDLMLEDDKMRSHYSSTWPWFRTTLRDRCVYYWIHLDKPGHLSVRSWQTKFWFWTHFHSVWNPFDRHKERKFDLKILQENVESLLTSKQLLVSNNLKQYQLTRRNNAARTQRC